MKRTAGASALAVVLVLGLGACGGDDGGSEADIKSEIADQLAEDGTLDRETADCFAQVIVDEIGADKLKDVDFSSDEPPEDLQEEFTGAAVKAIDACDLDLSSIGE
jgi:hypothetical protein